jgi:hypothetical protein
VYVVLGSNPGSQACQPSMLLNYIPTPANVKLSLSIYKDIVKVENLLIHRMCTDYSCYKNKILKRSCTISSPTEMILALTFSSQDNVSFLGCTSDALTYPITRKITAVL